MKNFKINMDLSFKQGDEEIHIFKGDIVELDEKDSYIASLIGMGYIEEIESEKVKTTSINEKN